MDIPVNAKVYCQDQECGKTMCVIINPVSIEVTHIVVQEKGFVGIERLVPVGEILESQANHISLRCDQTEFSKFEPFIESHFIGGEEELLDYKAEHYYVHPYLVPAFDEEFGYVPLIEEIERIPPDELGIHRGATVYARDDKVGRVDEFLISPEDNKISHLVLREGHLWGQKLVTIPVSEIDRIETDQVYLKLNKQAIEKLPEIPVQHHYFGKSR
jgi:uncharacterized protein YrrD